MPDPTFTPAACAPFLNRSSFLDSISYSCMLPARAAWKGVRRPGCSDRVLHWLAPGLRTRSYPKQAVPEAYWDSMESVENLCVMTAASPMASARRARPHQLQRVRLLMQLLQRLGNRGSRKKLTSRGIYPGVHACRIKRPLNPRDVMCHESFCTAARQRRHGCHFWWRGC